MKGNRFSVRDNRGKQFAEHHRNIVSSCLYLLKLTTNCESINKTPGCTYKRNEDTILTDSLPFRKSLAQ